MKKPKLPNRILIGNVAYEITELPQESRERGVDGDCSNVFNHTIRIDPDLIGHDAIETMFHETLHAIEDIYRINLNHKQVYQLSNALAHMVRYNPHITHWMEKIENYAEHEVLE